jgi:TonB family protein
MPADNAESVALFRRWKTMAMYDLLRCRMSRDRNAMSRRLSSLAAAWASLTLLPGGGIAQDTVLTASQSPLPEVTVAPAYPPSKLERGEDGWVVVRLSLDEAGAPVDIRVDGASDPAFEAAVLRRCRGFAGSLEWPAGRRSRPKTCCTA